MTSYYEQRYMVREYAALPDHKWMIYDNTRSIWIGKDGQNTGWETKEQAEKTAKDMNKEEKKILKQSKKELTILCPFCNAPYTADMTEQLDAIGEGCPTCNHGATATTTVEIACSNCERVVYRKETDLVR